MTTIWLVVALVLVLLVAGYGLLALGPNSFHAQWRDLAAAALADCPAPASSLVSAEDLADLPEPLAAYVRRSGAVGKPRVINVHAHFHGRIRSGPGEAWMRFTGEQVNTFDSRPRRTFLMDATRSGLPVSVLHSFREGAATMRGKVLSLFLRWMPPTSGVPSRTGTRPCPRNSPSMTRAIWSTSCPRTACAPVPTARPSSVNSGRPH